MRIIPPRKKPLTTSKDEPDGAGRRQEEPEAAGAQRLAPPRDCVKHHVHDTELAAIMISIASDQTNACCL